MYDRYQNPLTSRYASDEMASLWSDQRKFRSWRQLWLALAEAQQELGLEITDAQLEELRAHVDDVVLQPTFRELLEQDQGCTAG